MERAAAGAANAVRRRFQLLWLPFAAVILIAVTGIPKVTFDDALLRFFKSDFPAYADFVDVAQDFEDDSHDVILLFEADDLADPEALGAATALLLEAQFVDGVRAALSPLSIEFPADTGRTEPLVPFPLPEQAEMADRFEAVRAQSPALRRLLAEDRTAMLAILPITPDAEAQPSVLEDLDAIVAGDKGVLKVRMAGYPVMRAKLGQGLILDVVLLNTIGALVGFIVASTALRSVAMGVLTLPGPLIALLVSLGMFGHLGIAITTVTMTLPVLVMILATIDSIHIIFERVRQGGRESRRATIRAVRRLAMACLFAAGTTAIAFAVLTVSRADIVAELGWMGAGLLLLSSITVLLTQTVILGTAGARPGFQDKFARLAARPPRGGVFTLLPRFALSRPRAVTTLALALLVIALGFYSQAGPRFFMLDSLADEDPLRATFTSIEREVAPISELQVAVRSKDPEVLAAVEATLAGVGGSDLVQSVASLGGEGVAEGLPDVIARRLLSEDGTRALVTLPFVYESGAETLALAQRVDAALDANPALMGIDVSPATGMAVMSAGVISGVLDDLNLGLAVAVASVALLIALWLRSARIAAIALIPNLLPVALIGGWLALSGRGIELANGLALTVAFGVAVDDTLHVLNRIRLTGGFARIAPERLRAAMEEATPVLVTTSVLLVFGFGGSALASTQDVASFGTIATSVFLLALFADLLILPAAVAFLGPRFYVSHRKGSA